MEVDALKVVSLLNHKNIIDLISFYEWRDEVNLVFPFVEGNLNMVLRDGWVPANVSSLRRNAGLPDHWLWVGMVEVADALRAIHNPQSAKDKLFPGDPRTIIAFHFDLKPSNILVTSYGV
jgi:serine/threonine protein kinase